ncbi:adenylate/guanylate cyclase [Nitzschia inconspicua]|uniref:Adenylate/guanylate cyclase n=1 Tax=Nitzschia inconspicua TaxID=303405 RepID=A0A9K3LKF8_9STRA|nr:adenylate/guanylate cyclase [Nitzschia inconspicua]
MSPNRSWITEEEEEEFLSSMPSDSSESNVKNRKKVPIPFSGRSKSSTGNSKDQHSTTAVSSFSATTIPPSPTTPTTITETTSYSSIRNNMMLSPQTPSMSGGSYYSTPTVIPGNRTGSDGNIADDHTTKNGTKSNITTNINSRRRRDRRVVPSSQRSVASYDEAMANARRRKTKKNGIPLPLTTKTRLGHTQNTENFAVAPSSSSLYPSTGLDRQAILERLQRLSTHLAESMVNTLLDQVDREQNHITNIPQNHPTQKQSTATLTEEEKLHLIQAQMAELENRSDHHMNEHRLFELELDDPIDQLFSLGNDDNADGYHHASSSSSSSSSDFTESFNSSIYDIMPLAGSHDDKSSTNETSSNEMRVAAMAQIEQDRVQAQQQHHQQQQNHATLKSNNTKAVTVNNTESSSSTTNAAAEQLVTKIGQTRLNRTLRKTTGSVMGDNQSVLSDSNNNDSSSQHSLHQKQSHEDNNGMKRNTSKLSLASMPAELGTMDDYSQNRSQYDSAARASAVARAGPVLEADDDLLCDSHKSAICLVDISGFTNLSRSLTVEDLSKTINQYFQRIVDLIHWHGGDIIKFAGDALIVEWKEVKSQKQQQRGQPKRRVTSWQAVLNAATCASRIVDSCCDFPVRDRNNDVISTLNVHVGLGYGHVMACSVGDLQRREYLILGETIQQVADAMSHAQQGEVVASAEAYAILNESSFLINPSVFDDDNDGTRPQIIACKTDQYFKPKVETKELMVAGNSDPQAELVQRVGDWPVPVLERLLARMSSFVHPAVLSQELDGNHEVVATATVTRRRNSNDFGPTTTPTTAAAVAVDAELREVFTTFIQPDVDVKQIMGPDVKLKTVELLQKLMLIVNSEVTRFKGQLRQFIVDDKGLVIIANFGLRGSTYPNMVEERGLPCISNIKKLVKTELDLNCRIGATFGKAYCGIVGAVNRHEYAVLGSPVNLAARLMAAKDNNGILVDEAVKMKASHQPFESLEPIKAKGYDNLVKIYRPRESIRKSWKSLSSNFVSRNVEMGAVAQSAKDILKIRSHAQMIFFSGPYGVGKSLILAHAVNRVKRACSQALKTCYSSTYVFCDEDSFKPFSILRPLFLDLMKGKQSNYVSINLPNNYQRPGSVQGGSKRSGGCDLDSRSGHRSGYQTASTFSMGGSCDSVKSGSTASFADELLNEDETAMGGHVDEKMLNLELLKICLECGIPMNYVEVFGGLIFTNKLSDIGSWADRDQKQSEWDQIALFVVKAFLHITANYDLVVLALDEVGGMDEMSWKIIELLYHQSKNLLILCAARSQFDINIPDQFWEALTSPDNAYFTHRVLPNMENRETLQLVHKKLDRKMGGLHERDFQDIAKTVHILSNGNPLMATEILNKLYLKFTPAEEEHLENLGYVGELLMNRLDSLSANVLNHLNLGALLGASFYLDEVVSIMARYNQVPDESMAAHSVKVEAALEVAVENGILFLSTTSSCLYFFNQTGAGRPFDLDELVDERMRKFNLPPEERPANVDLVWGILEQRVQSGVLRKETFERTTYTFSHEFWQKSITWRTLDSWKTEMLKIKAELDALKRVARSSLMG